MDNAIAATTRVAASLKKIAMLREAFDVIMEPSLSSAEPSTRLAGEAHLSQSQYIAHWRLGQALALG
jgi:hypothetical protein